MSESLHRFPVLRRLGDGSHSFQGLLVERDENLPCIRYHVQPHEPCGFLNTRQQRPCESPQKHDDRRSCCRFDLRPNSLAMAMAFLTGAGGRVQSSECAGQVHDKRETSPNMYAVGTCKGTCVPYI